jgi:hypothetical protein
MRKLTSITAMALACALFVTSCRKDDNTKVSPTSTSGSSASGSSSSGGTDDKGGTSGSDDKGTTTSTGGTGTPSSKSPKLKYQLKASNTSFGVAAKGTAGSSITWTSATASPTMIKLEAKVGTSEVEYKTTNNVAIDLLASTASYFGSFSLPAGTYNEVELKITLAKGSSAAMALAGNYTSPAGTIPVRFEVNESVLLKTETHNVTLTDSASFTSVTTFDLSALMTGITESMLSGATLTGGTLVISASSNVSLYNIILSNFKNDDHHHGVNHD